LIIKAKQHLKYLLIEETTNRIIAEITNSQRDETITLENGKNYILKTTYINDSLENYKTFSLEPVEKKFATNNKLRKKWYI
jgi:predicted urease superfamily metal-dependent hydrolase